MAYRIVHTNVRSGKTVRQLSSDAFNSIHASTTRTYGSYAQAIQGLGFWKSRRGIFSNSSFFRLAGAYWPQPSRLVLTTYMYIHTHTIQTRIVIGLTSPEVPLCAFGQRNSPSVREHNRNIINIYIRRRRRNVHTRPSRRVLFAWYTRILIYIYIIGTIYSWAGLGSFTKRIFENKNPFFDSRTEMRFFRIVYKYNIILLSSYTICTRNPWYTHMRA